MALEMNEVIRELNTYLNHEFATTTKDIPVTQVCEHIAAKYGIFFRETQVKNFCVGAGQVCHSKQVAGRQRWFVWNREHPRRLKKQER
ncbi:MAG: hypothetical protein PHQ81_11650 [Methanofollis sp.]|nr:hypothetical protein [Methanofollis sp.]